MNSIHYNSIKDKLIYKNFIHQKNFVTLHKYEDYYYKTWSFDWSRSNITKQALNDGFYGQIGRDDLCSNLFCLIHDDNGDRGYISKQGKSFKKDTNFEQLNAFVNKKDRKDFLLTLLKNSLKTKMIYVDLTISNLVIYNNKINLIDLDSVCSFNFLFNNKKEHYENYLESEKYIGRRDLLKQLCNYNQYLYELGLVLDEEITSERQIKLMIKIIEEDKSNE
tara:strand:+ start:47 stop:709 length:663 start_codon:yes stop_codon:yes gene_type:complete